MVGVEARPLTRLLDTNTFFRALLVSGEPRLAEPVPAPGLPADRWLGTLPSPYALSVASGGAVDAVTFASAVLTPQIEAWAGEGAHLVVLDEPFVCRQPDMVGELVRSLAVLPSVCPLIVRLPFGDAAPVVKALLDSPVAGVGVDFWATSVESLPRPFGKFCWPGWWTCAALCSRIRPCWLGLAERLLELAPESVALVPNGDLQFVPEPIAREKLARLGEARRVIVGID